MKLFELAAKQSKSAAKVYESYFGDSINVDVMSANQARTMLNKVRKLVNEHKATKAFHSSEKNPTYLKLMMMERVLSAKVKETSTVPVGATAGATQNVNQQQSSVANPNPTVSKGQAIDAAKLAMIKDPKLKGAMTKASQGQALNIQDQQLVAQAAMQTESRQMRNTLYRILRESDVQQAQVVLAAQDMVDQIQKMSEQVSSMQFKDLPALCDQIKNQVGVDQAMQFNTDATAALAGLLQNLQGSKQQMDAALATVTGQAAPAVPGMDDGMGGEMPPEGDLGAEPDLGGLDDVEADVNIDAEIEEPEAPTGGAGLGRAKR
jgi:hypothetical protein